jgi:VWFA-related protein
MSGTARIRLLGSLSALLVLQVAGTLHPAAAQDQPPTFRAGVNIVRVDVIVTDEDGAPVADLTAPDFEIREGGKLQAIDTFQVVRLDGGRQESASEPPIGISSTDIEADEASRNDVRVFALFLDEFHVSKDWNAAVREQLTRFLQSLGPTDMVGLMYPVSAIGSMRLTRDHAAVIREVQKFDGRRDDSEGPVDVILRSEYRSPRRVPAVRVEASLKALKSLISRLGDLKEGRKSLIHVTQGFSGTLQRDLRELAELANRHHVAIYPVDPQIRPPEMQWRLNNSVGTLRRLAEDTGGREITDQALTVGDYRDRRPFNQPPRSALAAAMNQITKDVGSYYLLTYQSSQASDDRFHEIDVRVKGRDVEVRHRKGYWALGEDEVARAAAAKPMTTPTLVESALAAAPPIDASPFIRTWVGMGRGESGRTRVTFVWEPLPRTPGSQRDAENAARVSITALGPDGVEYFSGAGARVEFEVPPTAPVQLRLSVESARGTVLETDVRRLTAADFTPSAAVTMLGTPRVFRARTALELNKIRTDQNAAPTAARDFGRAEQLLIRVPVFAPDGALPTLRAELHNRAGRMLATLPVTGPSPSGPAAETTLPLASLPAGEYAVHLVAGGPAGDTTEIVVFRVVN